MKKNQFQTKLDWSRLLGFDQLMKAESFVRSKEIKDSQAAKVGAKGGKAKGAADTK